jgi:hypothetical protein
MAKIEIDSYERTKRDVARGKKIDDALVKAVKLMRSEARFYNDKANEGGGTEARSYLYQMGAELIAQWLRLDGVEISEED